MRDAHSLEGALSLCMQLLHDLCDQIFSTVFAASLCSQSVLVSGLFVFLRCFYACVRFKGFIFYLNIFLISYNFKAIC